MVGGCSSCREYEGVELRLATSEERESHAREQRVWWYVNKGWHCVAAIVNGMRLYRNPNLIDNIEPWTAINEVGVTHHLPGRVLRVFYHPRAMDEIFRYARNDPEGESSPFVGGGRGREGLIVDLLSEIFPERGIGSEEVIFTASLEGNEKLRNALHSYFLVGSRGGFRSVAEEIAKASISEWKNLGRFDLKSAVRRYSARVMVKLFIGECDRFEDCVASVEIATKTLSLRYMHRGEGDPAAFKSAKETLREVVEEMLKGEGSTFSKCLREKGLTDNEVVAALFSLLFGGVDTTASSLTYTLFFLARDRLWQGVVANEYRRASRSGRTLNLKNLRTLRSCIVRSLNEFAPVGMIGRTLREDAILELHEHTGNTMRFYLEKGEEVVASPSLFGRVYGGSLSRDSIGYSFGAGSHRCPGDDLALEMMVALVGAVVGEYVISTEALEKPREEGLFINEIMGEVPVLIEERKA